MFRFEVVTKLGSYRVASVTEMEIRRNVRVYGHC
jgi:hypothetical protein